VTAAEPDSAAAHTPLPPQRASVRFMLRHPAHLLALGFGSGLSPVAPGTVGTLWAWVAYLMLDPWLPATGWALLIAIGLAVGLWACTATARQLGVADPGSIVWDEVVAFWIVLWLLGTTSLWLQFGAFVTFRYFDAMKPGPVRWADRAFKCRPGEPIGLRQGFGILFDDLVAAGCTLFALAVLTRLLR
jgi:phosphatidylglycerophosphatase A